MKAAEKGNSYAMNHIGKLYEQGLVPPESPGKRDYCQAAFYYKKSIMAGNYNAMANLARLLEKGKGVKKNLPEALKLYHDAANNRVINAQIALARIFSKGKGVKKDSVESLKWHTEAAKLGCVNEQLVLGKIYEKGKCGVKKSLEDAKKWYKLASESSNDAKLAYERLCRLTNDFPPSNNKEQERPSVKSPRSPLRTSSSGSSIMIKEIRLDSHGSVPPSNSSPSLSHFTDENPTQSPPSPSVVNNL